MRTQLVRPLRPTHLILLAALASACGGGGGGSAEPPPAPDPGACVAIADEITFFRGPASNEWNDVLVDAQQRAWLAGYADGQVGQNNLDPSGNSRAVLRQLARDGSLLWDSGAEFDTPGTDVAEALALDAQGRVLVAGRTSGAFAGHANAGQFDSFVAWNSGAGWRVHQSGTERPQHPRRLSVAADGDIVVAGYDDIYIPTNFVEAWADPFVQRLARLDAGQPGERLQARWTHQFASSGDDQADALALDAGAGGSSYVAGAVNTGAGRGMFLRKLGADGGVSWTVQPGANPFGHIAAVIAQADGTLLVGGTVFGSFHGAQPVGEQDVFVARLDAADGRVLQAWQFGSVDSERLADMKQDAAGNLLLLGETVGAVVPGQPKAGEIDLFLMRVSPSGQLLAARQWGTADDEGARRLAVDACGRVLAVGYSAANGRRAGVMWFWKPAG
jgi:hypothetical protein